MSMATITEPKTETAVDESLEYREIYLGAIVGLVLGLISVSVLFTASTSLEACLMVSPIPLLGIFVSLRSWAKIAREPDRLTGNKLALSGFALSLLFLIGGVSYGGYVYATEVPVGYQRISFAQLKPDALDLRSSMAIPEEIVALAGKHVFIKGYMRPGSSPYRANIGQFLLVRDSNECCFGDISKVQYYDQMEVAMQGSLRVDYTTGIYRMGGILRIHPENLLRGAGYPVFSLEADYAK